MCLMARNTIAVVEETEGGVGVLAPREDGLLAGGVVPAVLPCVDAFDAAPVVCLDGEALVRGVDDGEQMMRSPGTGVGDWKLRAVRMARL